MDAVKEITRDDYCDAGFQVLAVTHTLNNPEKETLLSVYLAALTNAIFRNVIKTTALKIASQNPGIKSVDCEREVFDLFTELREKGQTL